MIELLYGKEVKTPFNTYLTDLCDSDSVHISKKMLNCLSFNSKKLFFFYGMPINSMMIIPIYL